MENQKQIFLIYVNFIQMNKIFFRKLYSKVFIGREILLFRKYWNWLLVESGLASVLESPDKFKI